MRVPLNWLREYCSPELATAGIEERLTMTGTEVETILQYDAGDGDVVDVLDLEITPNRPDCLGVYGVARELHAATGASLAPAPWSDDPGSEGPLAQSNAQGSSCGDAHPTAEVVVECPDLC